MFTIKVTDINLDFSRYIIRIIMYLVFRIALVTFRRMVPTMSISVPISIVLLLWLIKFVITILINSGTIRNVTNAFRFHLPQNIGLTRLSKSRVFRVNDWVNKFGSSSLDINRTSHIMHTSRQVRSKFLF